jgi:hypothetical protein
MTLAPGGKHKYIYNLFPLLKPRKKSLNYNSNLLWCHFITLAPGDNSFCGQYYKLFTAVITPLASYFSMILTESRRE